MKKNENIFWVCFLILGLLMPQTLRANNASFGATDPIHQDASDREYYPRLRELITASTQTIDIGLKDIKATGDHNDPVGHLINDLIYAQKKGVRVRLFLNTFSRGGFEASLFLSDHLLEKMRKTGIEVHFVRPDYHFGDRLMVVDNEWVLEGGLAWRKDDLEKGLGSATLTFSEALAQKKRMRLELLPLWDVDAKKQERREGRIPVPLFLLKEITFFPAMVRNDDSNALKIYLALIRKFFVLQQIGFSVGLEELGRETPSERYLEPGVLAYQVLTTLERLSKQYKLIDIHRKMPDRVELRLRLPDEIEPSVGVPVSFFHENYAKELSPQAIYVYFVILYKSQISGESPVWLGSGRNVESDFPLASEKFRYGAEELRRKNLIEIFPFRLKQDRKSRGAQSKEYRYLINGISTLAGRLATWSRLREQYGDDNMKKARQLASILGEPEDPKVVMAYLRMLEHYHEEDLRALSVHISSLPLDSTPSLLDYLHELLEHETQRNFQLATR